MGDEPIQQQVLFLEVPLLGDILLGVLLDFLVLQGGVLQEKNFPIHYGQRYYFFSSLDISVSSLK